MLDPRKALQFTLSEYDPSILERDEYKLPYFHNFRDRAHSQDALEKFLSKQDAVVIIQGGNACGKMALVSHVLYRRAYERSIVPIDRASANDVWALLGQYLFAIGCHASFEALNHEKELSFAQLDEQLKELFVAVSPKTIVVIDHFENILDPNGKVVNAEIRDFLTLMVSANKAKVIITTRKAPILDFFPESVVLADEQPPVGRFPEGPFVQNLLDDYVDRTVVGLDEYPDELLRAIDRYPYLSILAGQLIAQAGVIIATDPMTLDIIQLFSYDELAKKIASPAAQRALNLACTLRIPSSISLFENIVGKEATDAALETGLLFTVTDRYNYDLLSCAAVLRDSYSKSDMTDIDNSNDDPLLKMHIEIAKCYEKISRSTHSDPRWIREAHYHYLTSGVFGDLHNVGSLYKDELFWAGQTLFRRFHNYEHALELLLAAKSLGFITYESRMMIASCLIRTGKRGKRQFQQYI